MATATQDPDLKPKQLSEEESRKVAEEARESAWEAPSFLKEVFAGSFNLKILSSVPQAPAPRPEFLAFYDRLKTFLEEKVDSDRIDREGQYPPEIVKELAEMGAFGMKIPTKYGGLGMSQVEYGLVMELIGTQDANVLALLSAHQSIGVPQPLKLFGTDAQKEKYLPMIAKGAISAFALTEDEVGSDPANLSTMLTRTPEGDYILNGEKLWCTNGTFADLYVVMARHDDTKKISAVIVERAWEGVEVVRRCHFMGLRALENGIIKFTNVKVPKENLLLGEGKGLKLALVTLNTGRLSIPSGVMGMGKRMTQIARAWNSKRYQWGAIIGKHEAISQMTADNAATAFAIEAMAKLCNRMADTGGRDIRLEAAMAKMWCTEEGWTMLDKTLQMRGGRGYETADSLRARGEAPIPIERVMRDYRINMIFEGSSEIMRLFIAREALDTHMTIAWDVVNPKSTMGQRLGALPKVALFYSWWYPSRWFGLATPFKFHGHGRLGQHLRFAERATRKLSRALFHAMVKNGPKLEKKQVTLFRGVEIGADIFAMVAAILFAEDMKAQGLPQAQQCSDLADLFCRNTTMRIRGKFGLFTNNADAQKLKVNQQVLDGAHKWMEADLTKDEGVRMLDAR
ncbi:MAG: acyl-CoA dehydrogenase family protein [Holophagaceae bacterium]|nr:acyl-CoA dehydrogenase family protein [Holophagaceae bacterium]